jgi:imidazolonepropionase-like amidohydrolase
MKRLYPVLIKVVGQLHRSRVMLLAGTDVAVTRVPGFSLHDELSLLVKAGLTPLEAIQAATLNPANRVAKVSRFWRRRTGKDRRPRLAGCQTAGQH